MAYRQRKNNATSEVPRSATVREPHTIVSCPRLIILSATRAECSPRRFARRVTRIIIVARNQTSRSFRANPCARGKVVISCVDSVDRSKTGSGNPHPSTQSNMHRGTNEHPPIDRTGLTTQFKSPQAYVKPLQEKLITGPLQLAKEDVISTMTRWHA